MYNWKRKVEYSEYDSSVFLNKAKWDVRKESPKSTREIEISYFQLLVSTAKSILTRAHKYSPEVAAFARAYMETIPFLLSEKDGFLAFNNDNKDILRDFSKSTRHGEIAQGINYFLAKDYLGAYAIYDFKYYIKENKKIAQKCKGRTPDYILCYPDKSIGIIESKGTIEADPTKYLVSGYGQCKNGEKFLNNHSLNVHNVYVSAVSFAMSSPKMKRHTHIYLADPENDIYVEDNNMEKNRLYEYSKWFYLVGNKNITEKLMKGKEISEEDFKAITEKQDNDGIIINTLDIEKSQIRIQLN